MDAARGVVRRGVWIAGFFAVLFTVTYTVWAEDFMAFFDDDPVVVAIGVPFLVLIAMSFLASGTTMPLVAAMNGAGETRPPMVSAFVSNWLLELPLCWVLARPLEMGTNGVWVGMLISIVIEAAINVWWYGRGTWTTRRV